MSSDLHALAAGVVAARNCSGCGACAALSPTLSMQLDADGFLVPTATTATPSTPVPPEAARRFLEVCPGVSVRQPPRPASGRTHPVFGPYVSAWSAWATDPDIRWRGSSGGVLTALSSWLLATGRIPAASAAGRTAEQPLRTVPVTIRSREDALAAAGSRYAPVAMAAVVDAARAFVGKPCEADAARRVLASAGVEAEAQPPVFSFFCAGVPSQQATIDLIGDLGADPDDVTAVTYRGGGCPGEFVATSAGGNEVRTSYQESWGRHLGRRIHDRCKICPDGVGMHADVTVGDLWTTDESGYPSFEENDGVSVALARTPRGHELLLEARDRGVISLGELDLADVAEVQPSQVRRREELPGRLAGRRLAGREIPHYEGFELAGTALRRPVVNLRAARGAYLRARRES